MQREETETSIRECFIICRIIFKYMQEEVSHVKAEDIILLEVHKEQIVHK